MHEIRRDEDLVFCYLLDRWAAKLPTKVFARFPEHDNLTWTWREGYDHVKRAVSALAVLDVTAGEVVGLLDDHGPEYLRWFIAIPASGSVVAPLNSGFIGNMLRHALDLCQIRVLVCGPQYAKRLLDITPETLEVVVVTGPLPPERYAALHDRYRMVVLEDLDRGPAIPSPPGRPHYWDPYAVVFTSGTTGPSKAVLSPYGQIHAVVKDNLLPVVGPADVFLVDVPVFHVSGLLLVYSALASGGEIVCYRKPSMTDFWRRVREHGVTISTVLGIDVLASAPPTDRDRDNPLRGVVTARPLPQELRDRFGIDYSWGFYNMSELNAPIQFVPDQPPGKARSVGRVRADCEVRIVDEFDLELNQGDVGELIVRTRRPWEISIGYLNNPAATARAWRNGWFHTGDRFRVDEDGYYYFVDRMTDSIRRSGENISSFEVEREVATHSSIADCAVVAEPDTARGQEVRLVIVLREGSALSASELADYLKPRLPRYMLPRYIDIADALPRNPVGKILKAALRQQGLSASTWDRENVRGR